MTLSWNDIEIPVGGGIDTKTNEKLLKPPKLADLKNAVFTISGAYKKRFGYDRLITSTSLTSIAALATRGRELLTVADRKLYTYQGLSNNIDWNNKGAFLPLKVTEETLDTQSVNQTLADVVTHQGVTVYCWYDSGTSTVQWTAIEAASGVVISADNSIANSTKAKVVPSETSILIIYYNSSTSAIRCTCIPTYAPTSTTDVEIDSDADTDGLFDVAYNASFGDQAVLVWKEQTPEVHMAYVDGAGSIGSTETVVNTVLNEEDPRCLAVALSSTHSLTCGTDPAADYFWYSVRTFDRTEVAEDSWTTSTDVTAVACALSDGDIDVSGTNCHFWLELNTGSDANPWQQSVHYLKNHDVGTFNDASFSTLYGCGLASGGVAIGTEGYVHVVRDTDLQSTNFLIDSAGKVHAKCLLSVSEGLPSVPGTPVAAHLPNIHKTSDDELYWAATYKERLNIDNPLTGGVTSDYFAQVGIKKVTYDLTYTPQFIEYGNSSYITGGYLNHYDGVNLTEQGFHYYPENIATASTGTAGNLTALGTYNYRIYYEWTNARGERQRSTTGEIYTPSALTGSDDEYTLTIPTLTLTEKGTDVSIVVYRTEANVNIQGGAPFYRVSSADPSTAGSANGYLANSITTTTVTFNDEMSDANLITKELDYLNSGELDNVAPEAAHVIAEAKRRVWLAGFEDGSKVQYSKFNLGREQLSFNDTQFVQLPEEGGPVTAISELKHFVVLFKENRTYVVSGDGPDNLGRGFFNEPQLVDIGLGCIDQRTIAIVPEGVLFKSNKGIWMIDQNLTMQYVGAPVEAYNDQTITATTVLHDENQVRFLTSSGRTLVYDYLIKQWSTFTNHEGVSAVLWNDTYTYARNDGKVFTESTGYADDGVFYSMEMKTAPIAVKGIQGFQAIRKLMLLGEYYNAHNLRVRISYDHEPGFVDIGTWDPAGIVSTDFYGGDGTTTYGSGVYGGTGSPVYQASFNLPRHKCSVVQFIIDDIQSGAISSQSMQIVALQIEVGAKFGTNKLAADRNFSASGDSTP